MIRWQIFTRVAAILWLSVLASVDVPGIVDAGALAQTIPGAVGIYLPIVTR